MGTVPRLFPGQSIAGRHLLGAGPAAAIHLTHFTLDPRLLADPAAATLPRKTILPIFWILGVVGPMSSQGVGFPVASPAFHSPSETKESSQMKPAIFLLAAVGLAWSTGCSWPQGQCLTGLIQGSCQTAPENCAACCAGCGSGCAADCAECDDSAACATCQECGCRQRCFHCREAAAPGPPTAAITYPYYTVRGPRDFLARSPRSTGP
jgi:hypothetical protein